MSEEFDIEDAIHELGVLLADPMTGLMQKALETNWNEQYNKDFDLLIAWECFVGDVNRIETVIQLHDWLSEHITEIKKIESDENE